MKFSSVYRNIIANYFGAIVTTVIAFLLTPVYIKYLGVGSYGIIGFYISIQALFSFLDMGIGVAVNREMARHFHNPTEKAYLRTLTHTLQIIYWGIGFFFALFLWLVSPYFSKGWFGGTDSSLHNVNYIFIIFALTLFVRWPYGLYSSGLRGMQRQVLLNKFEIICNLSKSIGSWLVLKYVSPTLEAFLWYQFFITSLQTVGILILMWKQIYSSQHILKFDSNVVKKISKYAAGMGIGTILASIVTQVDKIIVSKMVTVAQFGYYTIANNIAMLVFSISLPIYMAIFPHFTRHVHEDDTQNLAKDFHYYSKLLSTLLLPFSIMVIFNSKIVLQLWMGDEEITTNSAGILQLLMAGTLCNALMMPVHTLLLAYNRLKFMLYSQTIEIILMVPLMLFLIKKFGLMGGALGVFLLFFCYLIIQAPLIFKVTKSTFLTIKWYFGDVLLFLIPVVLITYLCNTYLFQYFTKTKFEIGIYLTINIVLSYASAIFINQQLRVQIVNVLNTILKRNR